MNLAITAAITQLTAGLAEGSWSHALHFGHCVLKVHMSLKEFKFTVITPYGEVVGQHTNEGHALDTACKSAAQLVKNAHPEKPEPAADAAPAVPAPRADVPAAGQAFNAVNTQAIRHAA